MLRCNMDRNPINDICSHGDRPDRVLRAPSCGALKKGSFLNLRAPRPHGLRQRQFDKARCVGDTAKDRQGPRVEIGRIRQVTVKIHAPQPRGNSLA